MTASILPFAWSVLALAQANRGYAPGRECVGIGLVPQALTFAALAQSNRTDIGALSPRRGELHTGGRSSQLAGMACGFRLLRSLPALLYLPQGLDGLAQGGAGAIVGKSSHGGGFRALREACHGAHAGRAAP